MRYYDPVLTVIVLQERSNNDAVERSKARSAAQLDAFVTSPSNFLLITFVFDELVVTNVHDEVAAVRETKANCKETTQD